MKYLVPAALMLLSFTAPAQAYLDPGTGSMIISAIVGLFATLGLAIKTYWYKLVGLFRRTGKSTPKSADNASAAQADKAATKDTGDA